MTGNIEAGTNVPKPELFAGNWNHPFGCGTRNVQCRIVVDAGNEELVAAQAFDGVKWIDLGPNENADLAESLFEVNAVCKAPEDWGLSAIHSFPEWMSPETSAHRIIAVFQPQAWVNDYATDIDGRLDVDVTEAVLRLDLDRIHALRDDLDSTKKLVNPADFNHTGPFAVRVVDSVCDFFGVTHRDEITQKHLDQARKEVTYGDQDRTTS